MKTKKEYGKKKVSGKKHKSRLKNKKRTRMININSLRGGSNISVASINYKNKDVKKVINLINNTETQLDFEYKYYENNKLKKTTFYYISTLPINVDILQYLLNQNKITTNNDTSKKNEYGNLIQYLGIKTPYPSLLIETKDSLKYIDTKSNKGVFIDIMEDNDTFNLFYIKKYKHYYILSSHNQNNNENTGFIYNNVDYYNKYYEYLNKVKYKFNFEETYKDDLLFENIIYVKKIGNWLEEYYKLNSKYTSENTSENNNQTNSKKDYNLVEVTKNTKVKNSKSIYNTLLPSYLKNITLPLKIKKNINQKKIFIPQTENNFEEEPNKINFDSDLKGIPLKYIIIDEFENKELNTKGENIKTKYIICGYPEHKYMTQLINFFWSKDMFKEMNKKMGSEFSSLLTKLYNIYEKDKINNDSDLYKFYYKTRKPFYDYIFYIYKNYLNIDKQVYEDFEKKFEDNLTKYYNEIAIKYLNNPRTKISYTFLIYKQNRTNKSLVPFIFNVKELTIQHKPILERVNKLIKNELPYRFGILTKNDYEGKNNLFDNEYKLWYSYYRYGQFFHIKTEFLHTMSNLNDYSHNYKNSITLEELIYSCGIISNNNNTFFKDLVLTYQVRNNRLRTENVVNDTTITINNKILNKNKSIEKNRSDEVFDLYNKDKEKLNLELQKKNIKEREDLIKLKINELKLNGQIHKYNFLKEQNLNNLNNLNIHNTHKLMNKDDLNSLEKTLLKKEISLGIKKESYIDINDTFLNKKQIPNILLCYIEYGDLYIFIYEFDNKFYKLVIKANLQDLIDIIKNNILKYFTFNNKLNSNENIKNSNTNSNTNINDILSINNVIIFDEDVNIFTIISNEELITEDFSNIFKFNPLIIREIKRQPYEETIDLSFFYKSKLLNEKNTQYYTELKLKNLYNEKPILLQNFLNSKIYKLNKNYDESKLINYEKNNDNFIKCIYLDCPDIPINYIYYNINNCGYDFFETIDDNENKIQVYIYPTKIIQERKYKYIGNWLDLDDTSLLMLQEFKKIYSNKNNICFLHSTITPMFFCLHFHIIPASLYKRVYPKKIFGTFMIQDIFIDDIINNINTYSTYYTDSNYDLIRQ